MKVIIETLALGVFVAITALLLSVIVPKHANAAAPQVGQASWYGGFHHGRLMANGKPFNMHANTVAHRTLPLGTVVQVTNRKNGLSVTATVTDRGPYAKQRVLDVSKGIASRLDMLKSGTASVEITVLSKPEKKTRRQKLRPTEVVPVPESKFTPELDSIEILLTQLDQPNPSILVRN